SGRTAFDDEIGWLPPGGYNLQPALTRQLAELLDGAVLASHQDHFYRESSRRSGRAHPLEDHHPTARARGLGAAAEDCRRFTIGQAVDHPPKEIEIGAGRQRVEEALPDAGDPIGDAGGLEGLR